MILPVIAPVLPPVRADFRAPFAQDRFVVGSALDERAASPSELIEFAEIMPGDSLRTEADEEGDGRQRRDQEPQPDEEEEATG